MLGMDSRIGWDEGRVEGAFGEDRAKMIGQAQSDKERIGERSGAEHRGQHNITQKPGDTRGERQAADSEDAFEHGRAAALFRATPRYIFKAAAP